MVSLLLPLLPLFSTQKPKSPGKPCKWDHSSLLFKTLQWFPVSNRDQIQSPYNPYLTLCDLAPGVSSPPSTCSLLLLQSSQPAFLLFLQKPDKLWPWLSLSHCLCLGKNLSPYKVHFLTFIRSLVIRSIQAALFYDSISLLPFNSFYSYFSMLLLSYNTSYNIYCLLFMFCLFFLEYKLHRVKHFFFCFVHCRLSHIMTGNV